MASNNMNTFTIVDTESQKTKEIQSNATTVAELKRDLRQNGFNVDGKTIQEALTRTEFKDDNSMLPHDVPYKGGITNDLVFRLTKTNKQIMSGIDRQEVYAEVKRLGLGDAIKAKFGKNFTQCSTADLVAFLQSNKGSNKYAEKDAPANENKPVTPKTEEKEENHGEGYCKALIKKLCDKLVENDVLYEEDVEDIFEGESPVEAAIPASGNAPKYSKDELSTLLSSF